MIFCEPNYSCQKCLTANEKTVHLIFVVIEIFFFIDCNYKNFSQNILRFDKVLQADTSNISVYVVSKVSLIDSKKSTLSVWCTRTCSLF